MKTSLFGKKSSLKPCSERAYKKYGTYKYLHQNPQLTQTVHILCSVTWNHCTIRDKAQSLYDSKKAVKTLPKKCFDDDDDTVEI